MAEEALVDEPSIDDTIRETLSAINARNSEETPEEPAPAEVTPEPVADTTTETRARDETGKFVAKTATPEVAPEVPQETAPPETPADTPQIDLNRPPSSWKPAAKAQWANLPPDVRGEIYRREGDFHKGNSAIKENADFGQTIKNTVEPYRILIEAEGGTPEKAIADTMRTAALFRVGTPQQKLDALHQLDRQFNCGLNQHFNAMVAQEVARQTGQAPVAVQQAPQQFQDPRVDQLLASQQAAERAQAAQMATQASDAETRFRNSVDDKGQPQFPFVDNVESSMISRIPEIRKANPSLSHFDVLKQAYDDAVWANPETRAVLISQQQAQANQPVETLRKVEQAKRASAVNVPKRGALPATGPAKSLDDTIRETGQALGMF